ncbi:MAG: threonine/serine exporter family protein [Deltaproteobacteria bacterium]
MTPERQATEFVLALGRALAKYGAPAHRLEEALGRASRHFDLDGEFFSAPTSIMATFRIGETTQTNVLRVHGSEVDLTKLIELDRLVGELSSDVDPAQARERVRSIDDAPVPYRRSMTILSYGLVSASAGRFFGGGVAEIAVAGGIGLLVGVMATVMGRSPAGARAFDLVAAFTATMIAGAMHRFGVSIAPFVVTLAGLIVLIPGLTLTTALAEIATRNLVSGSARLTAATVVFLQLIFGVALGTRVQALLWEVPGPVTPEALPQWTFVFFLFVACVGLVVLFRAPVRTAPVILFAASVGLLGARIGGEALGGEIGIFVGAYLVCLSGNIYARVASRPAVVLIVPGLLLLVPGSVGMRSLSQLLAEDPLGGVTSAFATLLAAVSIVAGLLMANITVPPKRAL